MKLNISLTFSFLVGLCQILAQELQVCNLAEARFRKNLNQITDDEWCRYVSAVKKLNEGSRLTTWDKFIKNHVDYFSIAHFMGDESKNLFLAWHRLYLYYVEKELQKVDPTITIPYWDWTLNHKDIKNDIAFSDKFFGGESKDASECIVDGQFKDFKVNIIYQHQGEEYCLMRQNNIFENQFTDPEVLDGQYIAAKTFKEFTLLEFSPHGNVHEIVGSQFSGDASPGDPLFYSHHAFVDKIWYDWQNRNPDVALTYSQPLENLITPWNVTIRQVLDPFDNLCVAYREEHFSWSRPNLSLNSSLLAMAKDIKIESYIAPKGVTDPRALEEFDAMYINNGLMDVSKLRTSAKVTPIPKPISREYITRMKYNISMFREIERRDAIFLDYLNKGRLESGL